VERLDDSCSGDDDDFDEFEVKLLDSLVSGASKTKAH